MFFGDKRVSVGGTKCPLSSCQRQCYFRREIGLFSMQPQDRCEKMNQEGALSKVCDRWNN